MIKTYTYKLKPNDKLNTELEEWLGTTRYVYNVAKEIREDSYKKGVKINYYDLSKQLTDAKQEHAWLKRVHSQTLQATLERLEKGYDKFFTNLKKGIKTSKPKWAKKKDWNSIPFKSITIKNNRFCLPSLGTIKVFKFKVPKGELRTAILIKEVDGWYLKVTVKQEDYKVESQDIVGIDMGISYFLTTSDGEYVENPKHLFKFLKQLRVENRKLSRMKKGGSNWKKQVKRVKRLYLKLKRMRLDFLHKQSSKLSNRYGTVVIEDLNIRNMSRKSKLSKHILDCSWGMFFELLSYKTTVIRVSPNYTSQCCSKCNHTSQDNRKTQSHFECVKCGYIENADLNASFNILKLGQQLLEAKANH